MSERANGATMRKTTYREAVRSALRHALATDPRVFLMGEDVGKYGGSYAVSKGFLDEFGPERIRDAPLSELAFVGGGRLAFEYFRSVGYQPLDVGTMSADPVDYPDFAHPVASMVEHGKAKRGA